MSLSERWCFYENKFIFSDLLIIGNMQRTNAGGNDSPDGAHPPLYFSGRRCLQKHSAGNRQRMNVYNTRLGARRSPFKRKYFVCETDGDSYPSFGVVSLKQWSRPSLRERLAVESRVNRKVRFGLPSPCASATHVKLKQI